MYPPLLGKFLVPGTGDQTLLQNRVTAKEGWVVGVRYQPEPPLAVRGAMNPWADERRRGVFLAEEAAWKKIVVFQGEFRVLFAEWERLVVAMNRLMLSMNQIILELEGLTGKKSGMFSMENIATLLASSSGNPYVIGAMFLKMFVFDSLFGNKKKKKVEELVHRLEGMAKEVEGLQVKERVVRQRMNTVEQNVGRLVNTGEAIRQMQTVQVSQAIGQSETAYVARQGVERLRATVLRERTRQAALMPRRQGGSDAL